MTLKQRTGSGTGTMAQWLRAVAALLEDTNLTPNTYMAAHNRLKDLMDILQNAHGAQTYMRAK